MSLPARNYFYNFRSGEIGYLKLHRVTLDIDFTDEVIVQCYVHFEDAGNLQVITNKFLCENLWGPYLLYLDSVLCIVLVS